MVHAKGTRIWRSGKLSDQKQDWKESEKVACRASNRNRRVGRGEEYWCSTDRLNSRKSGDAFVNFLYLDRQMINVVRLSS